MLDRFVEQAFVLSVGPAFQRDVAKGFGFEAFAPGVDDRRRDRNECGPLLVQRRDDAAHLAGAVELRDDDHAHGALGQRDKVDEARRRRNVEAATVRVGGVRPVALSEKAGSANRDPN